jgi:predicted MFS family arabinose efflux permease
MLSALIAGTALALWRWLPSEPRGRTREKPPPAGGSVRRLLRHRQLLATDAIGFCVLFTQVAMFTYVTFHLSEPPYGLGTASLAWLFVVYLLGAAVTPLAGRWTDTLGHRAALGGGLAVGLAGASMTLAPWLPAIVLGLALVATGVFIAQAAASSYIGAVTRQDRGLAVGLYSTFYYVGGSIGGVLPSALWHVGGWPATVALVMSVQVATYGLAWTFWTPQRAMHVAPVPPGS